VTRQRGGFAAPCPVPTTDSEVTRIARLEVLPLLEAIAANAAYGLLGELAPVAVLEGVVVLSERAARRLRALIELS
jgi:hypothetical protein